MQTRGVLFHNPKIGSGVPKVWPGFCVIALGVPLKLDMTPSLAVYPPHDSLDYNEEGHHLVSIGRAHLT